jgi:hypothetical protein
MEKLSIDKAGAESSQLLKVRPHRSFQFKTPVLATA